MSAEACAWAVRQRLRGPEERLVLLLLANEAGPDGFVAHGFLGWLSEQARLDGCDLPGVLRRLLDAHVATWGASLSLAGYWLQTGRDFDLRSPAQALQALLDP